jgi:hypothetical protein
VRAHLLAAWIVAARGGTSRAPGNDASSGAPAAPPSSASIMVATPTVLGDENVRVVAFRRLIEQRSRFVVEARGAYCLGIGVEDEGRPRELRDPRPGVIERLQRLGLTVSPFSRCHSGDVLLYTAGIQWRRADEARINVASLGWVGRETDVLRLWYTVRLDPGGWRVTGEQVQPED